MYYYTETETKKQTDTVNSTHEKYGLDASGFFEKNFKNKLLKTALIFLGVQ